MSELTASGARHRAWADQIEEPVLDPELPICDAHHHLWPDTGHTGWPYTLPDLRTDTGSGHNVVRTVFLECRTQYRESGPEHLRPVGEVAFAANAAKESERSAGAEIAAIVGHADPTLGEAIEEVLEHEAEAGEGRFRGIRYITAQDPYPRLAMPASATMDDPRYRAGVRRLGTLGYSYDCMVYHPQLPEVAELAGACPRTPIVVNHLGGILGVGPYRDRRGEVLSFWKEAMSRLARRPNVFLKLGGIGMPMMGFRWDKQPAPPDSATLARAWEDPIRFAIDAFGPERCLFESNFPVDMRGVGYLVLWNSFKRIVARCSPDEKRWLFHDTAAKVYRLPSVSGRAQNGRPT